MRRPLASLLVPVTIIATGVVLLLNTLGILPWSSWANIGRFWPVPVILIGLSLLWRNCRFR